MDHRVAAVTQALSSTLGLQGERMSKVDTAWLRMDSPANLMMIVGVWVLRPGVAREALEQRVSERLLPIPRFRQFAREDAAGAAWIDDPDFDLARHITTHRLRRRRGQSEREALQARVGELARQIGLEAVDVGPLRHARIIEGLHYLRANALGGRINYYLRRDTSRD